jgi:hypothetical protein
MLLYTIGCSITNGYGVGFENSYPSLIKTNLNIDVINDSMCGAGNDWIFHTALENLSKLKKFPDLVILQWSGANRRVHIDLDGKEYFITINDYFHLHPKFEPMGSMHTIHYMFSLHSFLEKNNVPYLFFNYMDLDNSIKNLEIYKKINWSKCLNINKTTMSLKNYIYDNIGHPNLNGQYYIANEIIKKMDINYKIIPYIKNTLI